MFDAAIAWAKEYGDVLGTIGSIGAFTMIMLTNSKLIMQRVRGDGTGAGQLPSMKKSATPEFGNKIAVAVTPPTEMGAIREHFAEGILDDLITDLKKAGFAAPEQKTVARLVASDSDTRQLAHTLGVAYVLGTRIRYQDDKIRITAQLIDATGAIVWTDRYNASGDDLLTIQETTTANIAVQVSRNLVPKTDDPNTDEPNTDETEIAKSEITRPETKTGNASTERSFSPKSRLVALILGLPPLGLLGIHRFYIGRPFTGILYFFTAGLFVFGMLVDFLLTLSGVLADGKGRAVRLWRPIKPETDR